eukprot:6187095-Pleurochrysis_carterae.AAC.3
MQSCRTNQQPTASEQPNPFPSSLLIAFRTSPTYHITPHGTSDATQTRRVWQHQAHAVRPPGRHAASRTRPVTSARARTPLVARSTAAARLEGQERRLVVRAALREDADGLALGERRVHVRKHHAVVNLRRHLERQPAARKRALRPAPISRTSFGITNTAD